MRLVGERRLLVAAGAIILIGVLLVPVRVAGVAPTGTSVALLLVVPVVLVALTRSRRAAYLTAGVATLLMPLLLQPVGTFTIHFTDDVVALVVFFVVAVVVGELVSRRLELLVQVDRQREALVRAVSHDLRTPLAGIRAAASELGSDVEHDEETRAALLAVIEQRAEHLDRLVGDLLSIARSQAGALVANRQLVDLEELVRDVATRVERQDPDVAIDVRADAGLDEVLADYGLLDQLVGNLLENAVRHSPRPGTVTVEVEGQANGVTLTVRDQGPGVPPEQRHAIFEPFHSGARAGTSGLGLAICEAIIRSHAGTISVDDSPGGGAAFVVTLPAA